MRAVSLWVMVLGVGSSTVGAQPAVVAVSPTLFEYHSAFWVNLHHFIYERARGLGGYDRGRAIVAAAVADTAGEGTLSAAERAGLDRAMAYYAAHLASHDLLERDMARLKATLGDEEDAPTLAGAAGALDDSLRVVLEAAAPSYRRVWWPRHDAANRRWIGAMVPLVAAHGAAMQRALTRDFDIAWSDFLIRVDASAYSSWAGAYTTVYPDRITVATLDTTYSGLSGLEMLFHESLHTLDDSVDAAMKAAAARHGKTLPSNFTHAMIFFTAGEAARQVVPGYEPYAGRLGIWSRGAFPGDRAILVAEWQPFLDGHGSFADAIDRVAGALP